MNKAVFLHLTTVKRIIKYVKLNHNNSIIQRYYKIKIHTHFIIFQDEGVKLNKFSLNSDLDFKVGDENKQPIINYQQLNQENYFASPKKINESNRVDLQDKTLINEDVENKAKNSMSNSIVEKNGIQNRHKTPNQRVYVENQSINKLSTSNKHNANVGSLSNSKNNTNTSKLLSFTKKDQTPKNQILLDENHAQKSNNKSAVRDQQNDGQFTNIDVYKVKAANKISYDQQDKQKIQGGQNMKEQLNKILQQQNSSKIKKINVARHNSQVYAYPQNNQDSINYNQSFNIRQIKKKSSISIVDSQLVGTGGSGIISVLPITAQDLQVFKQNNNRSGDIESSGGKIKGQDSLYKFDSIRNIQNSQDNSSNNISMNNHRNMLNQNQNHQDQQMFQVNIFNKQERQDRIKEVYLGIKSNLTKKHNSPPKETTHNQYETIDNNKRKAKSTQRQQSILRERKQNGNTIQFMNLNQSNQSGGNTNYGSIGTQSNSNNNLSLYNLNQSNNMQSNNSAYESCYSSQNANRFYFRNKHNQNENTSCQQSGTASNQLQSSLVDTTQFVSSQSANKRQLPNIRDTYNTIDAINGNSSTGAGAPFGLYKAKNNSKASNYVEKYNYTNRTLDAQPLSTTSKQDKMHKLTTTTLNPNIERKQSNNNNTSYCYEGKTALPNASNNSNLININSRIINKKISEQFNKVSTINDSNLTNSSKINSRPQSIRRGRFQQSSQIQQHSQNKLINQKEQTTLFLQQQQLNIIQSPLQLQSCTNKDEKSGGQRFIKNEKYKQNNSQPQNNINLSELVDQPVHQKIERIQKFQENLQKGELIDYQQHKGYSTISIDEQKRCASQTENRPESQVQKDKQNYYKQSCGVDKIQHLKSIDTCDVIPHKAIYGRNEDRNSFNPIHSPLLNRDSSPVLQAHTPTKKRMKNQYEVNQKIDFFPQPPLHPPAQSLQQHHSQAKGQKYGQIIQKFQRCNIVKPKFGQQLNQQIQNLNIYQQNLENHYQSASTNPNSIGLFNKQGSQISTNIEFSSNQCQDISDLKFKNDDPQNCSLNEENVIQTEESMNNLVRSLQDEVYQDINLQATNQLDSANNYTHIQSLENSFQNYFTSSHIGLKSQKENETDNKYMQSPFSENKDFQVKIQQSSQTNDKPLETEQNSKDNKITENNEDTTNLQIQQNKKDDFIFSTLDELDLHTNGNKAKIIIDFEIDDDIQDYHIQKKERKNSINEQMQELKIYNYQNSQKNLIEEPIDSGKNSPQVSKLSSLKPLYYKYNNSYHQIFNINDNNNQELKNNDQFNQPPSNEKFIKNKLNTMRNSHLKQSIRYDNNFFNLQQE